jgi:hypothetical protein
MIWTITTYYNPQNYKSRYNNFKIFRKNIQTPLLVVEFSHNGNFQLTNEDATILIQIPKGDILWQKERLLNIALKNLPKEVDNVAWVDSDIIFEDQNWPLEAEKLLETNKVIQLFSHLIHLFPNKLKPQDNNVYRSGAIRHIKDFGFDPKKQTTFVDIRFQNGQSLGEPHKEPGFAWAAKRELLDKWGFFDKNIIGGGDNAVVCSMYKEFDGFVNKIWTWNNLFFKSKTKYYDECRQYYLDWAFSFSNDVDGKVDCIESTIYHLWHGDLKDRDYYKRYMNVAKLGFNPYTYLKINEFGAFEWNVDTPLKDYLIEYFKIRNEDKNT